MSEPNVDRDRWQRVKQLVADALTCPPADRAAFLAHACHAETALRHEVEALLMAHDAAGDVFERRRPAAASALASAGIPVSPRALHLTAVHRLGAYEIIEAIAAGGMGEVYRARDTRLHREVALKILSPALVADPARRERFVQEARAASALEHPHIAVIHEIAEADGVTFIVMELVRGEPLGDVIARGPLPPSRTLDLAIEIAEGLARAHDTGIVHRDLKPANVMVTAEGHAKIIDFGLAKLVDALSRDSIAVALAAPVTESGVVLGTASYMSPEQARGAQVDHRSDLFSFGIMLFEMLAGRPPFRGKTAIDTMHAILHDPVPPLPLISTVTNDLQRVLEKCLAKEPGDRYQRMNEVIVDLRAARRRLESNSSGEANTPVRGQRGHERSVSRWLRFAVLLTALGVLSSAIAFRSLRAVSSPDRWVQLTKWLGAADRRAHDTRTIQIRSLAVLPLENVSGEPSQEYFAEGMTDELITDLAQIGAIHVISRTSVMRYKGTNKSLKEIAQELNVDGVVEGSVLTSGDRVRVTAQLIDASTDTHVWAQRYERDLKDVLMLQDEIAQAVARAIQLKLTPPEAARLMSARSIDPEAHQAYLEGRYVWNQRGEENLAKALKYFQRAVERAPTFVAAYAGIADAYQILGSNGYRRPKEVLPLAKAAAVRAVDLDVNSVEAHTSLGGILAVYDWNWVGAEREFKTATALSANYAYAHLLWGNLLKFQGRWDDAIVEAKLALQLDPLAPQARTNLAWLLYFKGRHDEAIQILQDALAVEPNHSWTHQLLGLVYSRKVMDGQTVHELQEARRVGADEIHGIAYEGLAYANLGSKTLAVDRLNHLIELSRRQWVAPTLVASVCSRLGMVDQAFKWLDRAYEERDPYLLHMILGEPGFDSIRSDPRYSDLVRRIGLLS